MKRESRANPRWGSMVGAMLLCGSLSLLGQGTIEGRVSLPKPEPAPPAPRRYAGQVGEPAAPDRPVAVVYLEGNFPQPVNLPPATNVLLRQEGMQFRPALLPIQTGTAVAFPNDDDFYHNVFSYSKPKRFDLGRYRKQDEPPIEVFEKPGVIKLFCEIHSHMRGVILVLDTPYFTRTGPDGAYRLENLPAGKYLLKAWISEREVFEKPVELEAGKTLRVDFGGKNSSQ